MTTYQTGQAVWLSANGNYARIYRSVRMPIRAVVTAVKRKYFYVRPDDQPYEIRFDKETNQSVDEDCNASWSIWETEQAYHDEQERCRKISVIRKAVNEYGVEWKIGLDLARELYAALAGAGIIEEEGAV